MEQKSTRYKQGSIERRENAKGSVWRFRFTDANGKQKVLTFDCKLYPTQADVLKATERLRHQINTGTTYSQLEGIRVTDCMKMWLESLSGLKHQTMRCYRLSANRIGEQFGDMKIDDVKALAIMQWLYSLPVSPSQRAHHRFVFQSMFDYAYLAELTERENPCRKFKLKGTSKRIKTIVILTPDDFKRLLSFIRSPFNRMVLLAGSLGLRVGEILALQWDDFNTMKYTVTIKRNWSGSHIETPKTASSATVLPVPVSLMHLVSSWKTDALNEWLFPSVRSKHGLYAPGTIQQKVIWPACDAAGLPHIGWHTFRHSYRSWLDSQGISAGTSKDMMRHADIATTMNVYGRTLPAGMLEAANAIAELIQ